VNTFTIPGFGIDTSMERRSPDPPKAKPAPPNLDGDDVGFARFDPATGEIGSHGVMHRRHIKDEAEAGGHIIEHAENGLTLDCHRVDLKKRCIVDHKPKRDLAKEKQGAKDAALTAIAALLLQSDKYFVSDATDNITPAEQAQWRDYRQKLRAAARLDDPAAIVAAVPKTPKGVDLVAHLRTTGKPS
jgi:hypothetical protein